MPSSDNVYHRLDRANSIIKLLRETIELQRQREVREQEIREITAQIDRLRRAIMTIMPETGEM